MIRCGALFFSQDREKAEGAAKAAKRMTAAGTELKVREGSEAGLSEGGWIVSLDYGGTVLPVVHGWPGGEPGRGEFSMLTLTEGRLEASRDHCGTRPLYRGAHGRWVASDHRFLPEEPKSFVSRGAVLSVSTGGESNRRRAHRSFEGTFDDAVARLAFLIEDSVKARVAGKRRVAVAFSGGLDSSIVAHCAAAHCKVIACSVSAEGSVDSKVPRDTASTLGLEFAGMRVDDKRLKSEMRGIDLPFEPSPMDRSLWCIYSMTAKLAAESGAEFVMLGQLADELFGGYAKYEAALRRGGSVGAESLMSEDVAQCAVRGFVRDEAACRRWCEPRFPFAEREVATFGEGLPVAFKIRDGVRKAVLREAALALGLPAEIARRPKKAAQYSSGVMKLLS